LPEGDRCTAEIGTFRGWLLAEASSDLGELKKRGWSLRPMKETGD
jgi:LysR family glycine cleavage system transcriptional activator